jgi:hypothetical protein
VRFRRRSTKSQIGKGGHQLLPVFLDGDILEKQGKKIEGLSAGCVRTRILNFDTFAHEETRTKLFRLAVIFAHNNGTMTLAHELDGCRVASWIFARLVSSK